MMKIVIQERDQYFYEQRISIEKALNDKFDSIASKDEGPINSIIPIVA